MISFGLVRRSAFEVSHENDLKKLLSELISAFQRWHDLSVKNFNIIELFCLKNAPGRFFKVENVMNWLTFENYVIKTFEGVEHYFTILIPMLLHPNYIKLENKFPFKKCHVFSQKQNFVIK
jgi:hypothetical protein